MALVHCFRTIHKVLNDLCRLVLLFTRPRVAVAAENLFIQEQLTLFQERKLKPHRATDSTRWLMAFLSRVFDWRAALVVVKPDTLIRWQRKGFRLFWRWKSVCVRRNPPVGSGRICDEEEGRRQGMTGVRVAAHWSGSRSSSRCLG